MPAKLRLRVVDSEKPHARDLARSVVQKARELVSQPLVNQHEKVVKPMLRVDEILRASEGHNLIGKK